jgi:hypothetical protein
LKKQFSIDSFVIFSDNGIHNANSVILLPTKYLSSFSVDFSKLPVAGSINVIDSILSNFELVEKDIVDGYITFVVPNNMKEEFIDFLRSEDVNIIE